MRLPIVLLFLLLLFGLALPKASASTHQAGKVTTASTSLYVRSSPNGRVLTTLPKGSYVTLVSRSGDWWQVEYAKGKTGYCHTDYITIAQSSAVTVNIQSGSLNVRSGPGTGYSRVASLNKGEQVLALNTAGGWSQVLFHGTKTGYVSAQYLSGYYTPVSLSVPGMKQADPRWAELPMGTSTTLAKSGCATTAIAMMESYRTGSTITPDVMAQSLRYTSNNNVYWPSHFRVTTDSAGYLQKIYNLLRQGKPVLFGARNTKGMQHWVVITGFIGGTTLIPAAFTIQDPGTYSRTNLQQFLNAYPAFYKYFTY